MKLYFIKMGNKFLTKKTRLSMDSEPIYIDLSFDISDGRYWDKKSVVKGQATKLKNAGYKVSIVTANVVEERTEEQF